MYIYNIYIEREISTSVECITYNWGTSKKQRPALKRLRKIAGSVGGRVIQ